MGTNKRILPRLDKRIAVRFRLADDPKERTGYTDNISPRGLFIRTSHLPEPGQNVGMEIDLPGGTIRVEGKVAWKHWVPIDLRQTEHMGFGVEIHHATEEWFQQFI